MGYSWRFLLPAFLSASIWAQQQSDVAYLLDGVKQIAAGGYNGSLCVFGKQAFPVVNARTRDGTPEPVMGAGRLGKGRVVVFGHTGYLEQELFHIGDTAKLIENVARWSSAGKAAPRVGVYRVRRR